MKVRGHRPGSRGKPEVAALSVCNAVESLRGGGRSCGAGAGVLMKIPKHLSSKVRKTCPETNLESLPLSQVCKLSQQGVPAQPPPHPWHICSHQQSHEASLTQRLPSFPSQKMTTPISGISTLPIDSFGEGQGLSSPFRDSS